MTAYQLSMNYHLSMNSRRSIASKPKNISADMTVVYMAGWDAGFDAAWQNTPLSNLFKPFDSYAYKVGCKAGFKAGRSDAHQLFHPSPEKLFEDGYDSGSIAAWNGFIAKEFDSSGPFSPRTKWLEGYMAGHDDGVKEYKKETEN